MSEINYNKFRDSLARLIERYNDYENNKGLETFIEESIEESCIHRFKICFDTAWKHIKKYLREEIGLSDVPDGPNPVFRKAAASQVIEDAEIWIEFNKKRGDTSHDYCGDKANATFEIIPDFIKEATHLFEKMSGKKIIANLQLPT